MQNGELLVTSTTLVRADSLEEDWVELITQTETSSKQVNETIEAWVMIEPECQRGSLYSSFEVIQDYQPKIEPKN